MCDDSAEFGEVTEDHKDEMRHYLAEEDAIDLQCLIDGHSDRDRAELGREESHVTRELLQVFRAVSSRTSTPLTWADAKRVASECYPSGVLHAVVYAAFELLKEEKTSDS